MKSAIFAFLAAGLFIAGVACTPDTEAATENEINTGQPSRGQKPAGLNASWKETASYFSIGDANIHWATTPPDSAETIRFQPGNIFYSNRQPERNRYLLDSSVTPTGLKVFTEGKSDTLRWHLTPLSADTIDIALPCIEPCGKRFVRISE